MNIIHIALIEHVQYIPVRGPSLDQYILDQFLVDSKENVFSYQTFALSCEMTSRIPEGIYLYFVRIIYNSIQLNHINIKYQSNLI